MCSIRAIFASEWQRNIMKKFLFLYSCLLASVLTASAQSIDRNHLSISAGGRYSHVLDGHNIYSNLIDGHNYGIFDAKVGLSTRPEDGNWFERAFNYPTFGIGLSYARLRFTTETPAQCAAILRAHMEGRDFEPEDVTRGLFYRGVE